MGKRRSVLGITVGNRRAMGGKREERERKGSMRAVRNKIRKVTA